MEMSSVPPSKPGRSPKAIPTDSIQPDGINEISTGEELLVPNEESTLNLKGLDVKLREPNQVQAQQLYNEKLIDSEAVGGDNNASSALAATRHVQDTTEPTSQASSEMQFETSSSLHINSQIQVSSSVCPTDRAKTSKLSQQESTATSAGTTEPVMEDLFVQETETTYKKEQLVASVVSLAKNGKQSTEKAMLPRNYPTQESIPSSAEKSDSTLKPSTSTLNNSSVSFKNDTTTLKTVESEPSATKTPQCLTNECYIERTEKLISLPSPEPFSQYEKSESLSLPEPFPQDEKSESLPSPEPFTQDEKSKSLSSPEPFTQDEKSKSLPSLEPFSQDEKSESLPSPTPSPNSDVLDLETLELLSKKELVNICDARFITENTKKALETNSESFTLVVAPKAEMQKLPVLQKSGTLAFFEYPDDQTREGKDPSPVLLITWIYVFLRKIFPQKDIQIKGKHANIILDVNQRAEQYAREIISELQEKQKNLSNSQKLKVVLNDSDNHKGILQDKHEIDANPQIYMVSANTQRHQEENPRKTNPKKKSKVPKANIKEIFFPQVNTGDNGTDCCLVALAAHLDLEMTLNLQVYIVSGDKDFSPLKGYLKRVTVCPNPHGKKKEQKEKREAIWHIILGNT